MALSDIITSSFEDLKILKQRKDYHPEGDVFSHEAYVWFQLRNMLEDGSQKQKEMMLVAAFHDIGKIPTTDRKSEEKGGYIISYGHANKSLYYWDAVSESLTENSEVRSDVVRWLIKEHMNIKFSDRLNESTLKKKREEANSLGEEVWNMGRVFKKADDMISFFEEQDLDYRDDADASEDHLEPLDRHEEAIGRFRSYISRLIDNIRDWESEYTDKELIIIRGVPGCGKTTFANLISNDERKVYETDKYFESEDGYEFDKSKLGEAHEWCENQIENTMREGVKKIIVSNTSTQVWEFLPYIYLASKYGYRVHSVIKENRHQSKDVHSVPSSTIKDMKKRFEIKL